MIGILAGALAGCSEQGLAVDPDGVVAPGVDTAAGDPLGPDPGGNEGPGAPDDPCWEPEDGYTKNPGARLVVTDDSVPVEVVWVGSFAGYDQVLRLDAPEDVVLGDPEVDPVGTRRLVGPYPVGTELVFADDVLDTGHTWYSGPASRNVDGEIHGAVTFRGDCRFRIGFEDEEGGGDRDHDDILLHVSGPLRQD